MTRHRIFLGCYQISVKEFRTTNLIPLNEIGEAGPSLLEFFYTFMMDPTFYNQGSTEPQRYRVRTSTVTLDSKSHTVHGVIEAGEAGLPADLVDDKTAELRIKRLIDDAEMIPYYFQLHCPKDTKLAILILQRIGQRGPYAFFAKFLEEAFRTAFARTHRIILEPHVPPRVLNAMANAPVRQVTITNPKVDDKDKLFETGWQPDSFTVKQVYTAHRNETLPMLKEYLRKALQPSKKQANADGGAWDDLGDSISVTFQMPGGTERSYSFGISREVAPYVDVTDRMAFDKDGYVTRQSIHGVADEIASEVRDEIDI